MRFDYTNFSQSFLTKGILLLLALTFVIGFGYVGGVNLGGQGTGGGTAVTVNGEKVTYAQFKNMQDALRRQYTQNMDEVPPEIMDFIKFSALNNIVELKLMAQKAEQLGLRVTKQELAETITTNPAFQVDGVFVGKERYSQFINQRLNLTVADFEQSYKEEILAKKLIDLINESAKVTDEELLNLYKTKNEKVNLEYVEFSKKDFTDSVIPDENQISEYYGQNKDSFLTDEKRKIDYIKLSVDSFIPGAVVSEEELKAYYNAYTEEFREEEELLDYEEVKSRIEAKLVSKRAENSYNDFVSSFSAEKINDLKDVTVVSDSEEIDTTQFFSKTAEVTDIPRSVVNRTFTMAKGDVALVTDDATSWLFKLEEIKSPEAKELSEVKDEIVEILKEQKAGDAARVSAEESLKKFESTGTGFAQTAKDLGLEVKKTEFFTRLEGPQEIPSEEIAIDSFQLDKNSPLLNKVYESGGKYYIASLNEKQEINREMFEEEKFAVKEKEISRQKRQILKDWLEDMRSEAKIIPNQNLFPSRS